MSDDPAAPTAGGGKPKFLTGTSGIVAGITSLVVAVTGLLAACDKLFPAEQQPTVAAAGAAAGAAADGKPAAQPPQAEVESHLVYEGDDLKLEWGDPSKWTFTDSEGAYVYEEMLGDNEHQLIAYNKEYDSYLRWPVSGGALEESTDDRRSWTTLGRLYPADEETTAG